jgi:hypothetical protein
MSIVIGIDNGISGGIVAISAHHGLIIATTAMPSKKHRARNEVDIGGTPFADTWRRITPFIAASRRKAGKKRC